MNKITRKRGRRRANPPVMVTLDDAAKIRRAVAAEAPVWYLAEEYHVTPQYITAIVVGDARRPAEDDVEQWQLIRAARRKRRAEVKRRARNRAALKRLIERAARD